VQKVISCHVVLSRLSSLRAFPALLAAPAERKHQHKMAEQSSLASKAMGAWCSQWGAQGFLGSVGTLQCSSLQVASFTLEDRAPTVK